MMRSKLTRASVGAAALLTLIGMNSRAPAYVPVDGARSSYLAQAEQAASADASIAAAASLLRRAVREVPVEDLAKLRWPIRGAINTPFSGDHAGIDIEGETGDPIRAAASGHILFADDEGDGYGTKIVIRHDPKLSTLYAHLSRIKVSRGDVDRGELIGYVGCTGSCTGDHLHFEVREQDTPVNPLDYLRN